MGSNLPSPPASLRGATENGNRLIELKLNTILSINSGEREKDVMITELYWTELKWKWIELNWKSSFISVLTSDHNLTYFL